MSAIITNQFRRNSRKLFLEDVSDVGHTHVEADITVPFITEQTNNDFLISVYDEDNSSTVVDK